LRAVVADIFQAAGLSAPSAARAAAPMISSRVTMAHRELVVVEIKTTTGITGTGR
jgi:hypothetical protein